MKHTLRCVDARAYIDLVCIGRLREKCDIFYICDDEFRYSRYPFTLRLGYRELKALVSERFAPLIMFAALDLYVDNKYSIRTILTI